MSRDEGGRVLRWVMKGVGVGEWVLVWRAVVNVLVVVRDDLAMRERSKGVIWFSSSAGGGPMGLALSSEGRKKGAFSGALGGSLGLLRWRMVSRWRRVCQRDLGTRLRVWRSWLSWSVDVDVGNAGFGISSSDASSSKAASMRPWPPSPDEVGAMAGIISCSWICRVGTWVNNVRLFHMLMPRLSA